MGAGLAAIGGSMMSSGIGSALGGGMMGAIGGGMLSGGLTSMMGGGDFFGGALKGGVTGGLGNAAGAGADMAGKAGDNAFLPDAVNKSMPDVASNLMPGEDVLKGEGGNWLDDINGMLGEDEPTMGSLIGALLTPQQGGQMPMQQQSSSQGMMGNLNSQDNSFLPNEAGNPYVASLLAQLGRV